ncbi:helix-turn-helix domain-containing protein [Pigmentiphaga sp. GD03639]|jgi:DNA-binding IclR family transcriptional regulator|uniref:IclR family transcriptional regulator n=1 Tax=Pigmentiphaga daeguensis TaxID=414049 RepID=A0ABN1B653_9BURK|nr:MULTISPECIES: helix-turn-helix domain-containing protein [unclassified Pigmentiphaga]MDH2239271.1 helix-turn-helix domain-containing protein [Pigmentiphaga sp. GD03639]OVZ61466.1 IclR family transcriptional regulator [Pigmentiphaga sp. NML030171]
MVRTRQPALESPQTADTQVDSLRRGLEILRLFDVRHRRLSLDDISSRLGLTRTTTDKLVQTLLNHHFLQSLGNDVYQPHIACLSLGRAVKRRLPTAQAARPLMLELSQRYGVHVTLTTRDRLHMLVVEHCVPSGKVRLGLTTGSRFSMISSASGRAYLWGQPEEQRRMLLAQIEDEAGPAAQRQIADTRTAFQELDRNGWCYLASPVANQTASIATPVHAGTAVEFALAAMAVGASLTEKDLRQQVAPELFAVAQRIALTKDAGR